jgi:hypothetical protein
VSPPDFVGIGALKAGTTYLDAMLRAHPGLCLPRNLKEVEFFTDHYRRGLPWYERQFEGEDGRPRGEVSPAYLVSPEAPERIAHTNANARLLLLVRHPVHRLSSQHRHWAQETGYAGSLSDFVAEHPSAIERGMYGCHLRRYLQFFPRDQIHVVAFDDLITQPLSALSEVYRFLGVDADFQPPEYALPRNISSVPRFPVSYVHTKRVSRWLYARGLGRLVAAAKRTGIDRVLRDRSAGRQADSASLAAPDVVAELGRLYAADVTDLSTLIGRDFSALWDLPRAPESAAVAGIS